MNIPIGTKIKSLRLQRKLSQRELCGLQFSNRQHKENPPF